MDHWTATELPRLISASVTFLGILGGSMSAVSGLAALPSLLRGDPPEWLAARLNLGLAAGFVVGAPWAIMGLIVALNGKVGT